MVDVKRAWFKARVGVDVDEIPRNLAINGLLLLEEHPRCIVIPDTHLDVRFKDKELVLGPPFVRFYAGASIIVEGIKVATLCLIDQTPRDANGFTQNDMDVLVEIADIISAMMTKRRREKLEEQFNGVMMHQNILTMLKAPLQHLSTVFEEKVTMTAANAVPEIKVVKVFDNKLQSFASLLEMALQFLVRSVVNPESTPNTRVTTPAIKPKSSSYQTFESCDLCDDYKQQENLCSMIECNIRQLTGYINEVVYNLYFEGSTRQSCGVNENRAQVKNRITKTSSLYSHTDLLLVCFATLIHYHCQYLTKHASDISMAESCPTVELTEEMDMLGIVLTGFSSAYIKHLGTCHDIPSSLASMLRWVDGHFVVEDMMVGIWVPCKMEP